MAITISLADLVVTTAGTFDDAAQVVHIGDKDITAVRSADGKVLTLPGYGTLTFINDAPNHVAFQGDAALAGGEYAFESQGSNAIVTVADFSNVTAAVTVNGAFDEIIGGMGDDMLRGAAYSGKIIQGGAGNDTITIADFCGIQTIDAGAGDDLVDIGGGSQEVSLGAGADTVQLHGIAGYGNKIVDYSYAEGDKVILKEKFQGSETLGSNGQFITGGILPQYPRPLKILLIKLR